MKTNTQDKKKLKTSLKSISQSMDQKGIQSFQEQPDIESTERIGAHDLFSMFTATIIKKKVTFTR